MSPLSLIDFEASDNHSFKCIGIDTQSYSPGLSDSNSAARCFSQTISQPLFSATAFCKGLYIFAHDPRMTTDLQCHIKYMTDRLVLPGRELKRCGSHWCTSPLRNWRQRLRLFQHPLLRWRRYRPGLRFGLCRRRSGRPGRWRRRTRALELRKPLQTNLYPT